MGISSVRRILHRGRVTADNDAPVFPRGRGARSNQATAGRRGSKKIQKQVGWLVEMMPKTYVLPPLALSVCLSVCPSACLTDCFFMCASPRPPHPLTPHSATLPQSHVTTNQQPPAPSCLPSLYKQKQVGWLKGILKHMCFRLLLCLSVCLSACLPDCFLTYASPLPPHPLNPHSAPLPLTCHDQSTAPRLLPLSLSLQTFLVPASALRLAAIVPVSSMRSRFFAARSPATAEDSWCSASRRRWDN